MARLLIVDDDQDLVGLLQMQLASEGHIVECACNGSDGLHMMLFESYDLVILDVNMPRMNGFDVCSEYRKLGGVARILMLTTRAEALDKGLGLDQGADDYLTKPFNVVELSARIRALMRRGRDVLDNVLQVGALRFDTKERRASKSGQTLPLTPKELSLLEFFMRNPNQLFSAEAILERVWNSEQEASLASVRIAIKRLRDKLGANDEEVPIKNVFGAGYRLDSPSNS